MLITFEGIDGSGKSTQARLLVEHLEAEGLDPLLVREPGGTELSERIRTVLLDARLGIDPYAEMLLFSAARAQLVAERIRPALAAGRIVVCDRFYDSTVAYQGGGRRLEDPDWLRDFNRRVTGGLVPDRTYLIEIDLSTALARRRNRAGSGAAKSDDRMEAAGPDFLDRVVAAYRELARSESERIVRLDGTQPVEELHARIREDVALLRTRTTRNQEIG